ncbi:MAG: ESPR domain-containing protein, partial [Gallionellaceae bacterium]|nr:ESPR domain-containing protein [Gallionellaceae bacterium]
MNQTYKVVFNHSLGIWQAVSELAKSHGKSKSVTLAVGLAAALGVSVAHAGGITTTGQTATTLQVNGN